LAVGCGSDPTKPEAPKQPKLPEGAQIAVIAFRDCVIAGQEEDCANSGQTTTSIFATTLNDPPHVTAISVTRPVGPKETLDDASAVAYGKSKGYQYVLNGEVTNFYRVAAMTFRREQASVTVRVLRVSDGQVVYAHSDDSTGNNLFGSPEKLMQDMAKDVLDDLEDN
jgi:hypothetical protein